MKLLRRHFRLLTALVLGGVLAAAASAFAQRPLTVVLVGVDGFFAGYLGLTLWLALQSTAADLRRRAEEDDEGIALILIIAISAVLVSLWAIFQVLVSPDQGEFTIALSLVAVPLGWAMVNTLAAFRYARLFYSDGKGCGLNFPNSAEPEPWDFMYFSFAIGTSAAASDVDVESTRMRQLVLLHSTGVFFYNTVILALAVNAGLVLAEASP